VDLSSRGLGVLSLLFYCRLSLMDAWRDARYSIYLSSYPTLSTLDSEILSSPNQHSITQSQSSPILKRSAESRIRSLDLNPSLNLSIIASESTSTSNEPVKSLPGGAGLSTLNSALRFCYAFVTHLHLHYQLSSMDLFYSTQPTILSFQYPPLHAFVSSFILHTFIPPPFHTFIPPPFIPPYLHPHTSTISIPISTASYTSMHHDHFYLLGFFGL